MGVLNVTPDSFSDGGLYLDAVRAKRTSTELFVGGADIIDIGASRRGPARLRSLHAEQIARIEHALVYAVQRAARRRLGRHDSLEVAPLYALSEGAAIVNDVPLPHDEAIARSPTPSGSLVLMQRAAR
jgi:dihydropteroate synthase